MDYEKRYKEALERAREYHKVDYDNTMKVHAKGTMEYLFPELKESEDERIRKGILALIEWSKSYSASGITTDEAKEMLAWLEKQGEKKSSDEVLKIRQEVYQSGYNDGYKHGCADTIGEQKSINYADEDDKVDSKFKAGDWIIDIQDGEILHINKVRDYAYYVTNLEGASFDIPRCSIETWNRLWTIQDAEDGDILHSIGCHNDCIFIFNGLDKWIFDEPNGDRAVATGYCCLSVSADKMEFGIQGPDCIEVDTVRPATKEQRETLFKAMKEAGYEWDADKKEPKKIEPKPDMEIKTPEESLGIDSDTYNKIVDECIYGEQKPNWSEEDIKALNRISTILVDASEVKNWWKEYRLIEREEMIRLTNFLKSLIDRIHPQPTEWSEEDEKHRNAAICACSYMIENFENSTKIYEDANDWLKSLKPQNNWKPSEEQISALEYQVNSTYIGSWQYKASKELLEQLKKL